MYKTFLVCFLMLCVTVTTALAQEDCPAIVLQALEATQDACVDTGRNQACYGNIQLSATPREGVPDFQFTAPGDIVDLASVQALELAALNESESAWGVALMKIQANLPDTLPGQNVTFLLFGDVEMRDANASAVFAPITLTASGNANVRATPSTNGTIAGALTGGQTVTADGRNADSTWLHIQEPLGWVFADLVSAAGDVSTLPVLEGVATVAEAPVMQSFYFTTGIGEATCAEAPNGILIQSPVESQRVTLTINGSLLNIGSTVFISAPREDGQMTVAALAGVVEVEAAGESQTFVQGTQVNIPLDADGNASGAPGEPQPLAVDELSPLVALVNSTEILVPTYEDAAANPIIQELGITPLTEDDPIVAIPEDEIEAVIDRAGELLMAAGMYPTAGIWLRQYGQTVVTGDCSGVGMGSGGGVEFNPADPNNHAALCTITEEGVVLLDHVLYTWDSEKFADEPYEDGMGGTTSRVLNVIDPSHIEVVTTSINGECNIQMPMSYELIEPGTVFACSQLSEEGFEIPEIADPERGTYIIEWLPFDETCELSLQPQFTEVVINRVSNENLSIEMNGETYNLSGWDGEYNYYGDIENGSEYFDIKRRFADDFTINWNQSTDDGLYCGATGFIEFSGE